LTPTVATQSDPRFEYSKSFQRLVLAALIQKPGLLLAHQGVLKSHFFDDPLHEVLAEAILGFWVDWGVPPTLVSLQEMMRRGKQQVNLDLPVLDRLVESLYEPHPDLDFVAQEVLTFCRVVAIRQAGIKSIGHLQKRDVDAVVRLYEQAFVVGKYMRDGLGLVYLTDELGSRGNVGQITIPLCIESLDRHLQGGLAPKELGVVLGASGAGKSMALLHFARAAVMWGKKVVYYTLELSKELVYARFDSSFSGVPFQELEFSSGKISAVKKRLQRWYGSPLLVKEFATKEATVADIRAHLDMVEAELWKPDMIIVDYADLIAPLIQREQIWAEMTSVYEGLRGLAMSRNLAVWTASQVTRDAFDREVVRQQDVSSSIGKVQTADVVLAIANPADLRSKNRLRVAIAKVRRGQSGTLVDFTHDFARATFYVFNPEVK